MRPIRGLYVVRGAATPPRLVSRTSVGVHHTETVDRSWDSGTHVGRLESPMTLATARDMYAWYDGSRVDDGRVVKDACKLPHHEVTSGGDPGPANLSAVRNALARLPQSDIPESEQAAVQRHLRAHLEDGGGGGESNSRVDDPTMVVEFSRFDTWYEIDGFFEGRFLERVARGSFRRTIEHLSNNLTRMKVMFNHGYDPTMGRQLLGVPAVLEERETSPFMEVPLLRGVPELIVEGLRAGAYGSSFMFEVIDDRWDDHPQRTEHNPDALPERTITEVRLLEAGPVSWPANPEATSALRSGVDWYLENVDEDVRDSQARLYAAFRAQHGLRTADAPATPPQEPTPIDPAPGSMSARHSTGMSRARRERELLLEGVGR